jgi:hypothetical protein
MNKTDSVLRTRLDFILREYAVKSLNTVKANRVLNTEYIFNFRLNGLS